MDDANVAADRFQEEQGVACIDSPFRDGADGDQEVDGMPETDGRDVCRCGGACAAPATFHTDLEGVDPEDARASEPEQVSLEAVLGRALENAVRSEPTETLNLRWINDDLRGWLGVRLGFAPGLPWRLTDAWNRATRTLGVLAKYIEKRRLELPADRKFVAGAAVLVGWIGRTLAAEGLGSAAAHHAVWEAAEAAEAESQRKVA